MTISVVIPTRARPGYLEEALRSVAAQTRWPDEVIVSEDGSDERTAEVVRACGLAVTHVVNDPPLGQLRNRQQALRSATGELVAMLDDDDRWDPAFLEIMEAALAANERCAFASADHWWMDEHGAILPAETERASARFGRRAMTEGVHPDVLARTLKTMPFALQFTLFRRAALEEVGFFPDAGGTTPDFALMLLLGARGATAYYVDRRLGAYRIHPGQHTALGRVEHSTARVESLRAVARECPPAERALVARTYREAALENAIALAHDGCRREAVATAARIWELGVGAVRPSRMVVLVALLAGLRRR